MGLNYMHRIIIFVFSISVTVLANENSQLYVPCKPGWYLFGEKCYNLISTGTHPRLFLEGLDWERARYVCLHFKGHLASIHSDELQEFITIFLLLNLKTRAWIGLHDKGIKDFYWNDGSMYNYTNWDRNEPSYKYETGDFWEHCAAMLYYNSKDGIGKWHRISCSSFIPFICQANKNDNENSPDPRFCSSEEGGGWKYLNSCYHIVKEEKSWEDAEEYCEEKYRGFLVSVLDDNSELFQNYIQRFSNLTENIWIGIKMRNDSMQKWSSGWHVAYKRWNQERFNFVNGTCALKSNGSWEVAPCLSKYPFICEKLKYNVPVLKKPPSDGWKCPDLSVKWLDLESEHCYYIEAQNSRNWFVAADECRRIGGTLTSFHSEDETNILYPHVLDTKQRRLWIGLRRTSERNYFFEWEDGTEVIYRNWAWEQRFLWHSHDRENERCGDISTASMQWNVVDCNISQGYICKSKKVLSKLKVISSPAPCVCAVSKNQTCWGGIPSGPVFGIVICTLLVVLLVGVIVYYSRNFWKRYCMKTENDDFTSSASVSLGHVPEKVIWKPLI